MEEKSKNGQIKLDIKKIAQKKLAAVFLSSPVLLIIGIAIIFIMIIIVILVFASDFSFLNNISFGYYNLPDNIKVANTTYPIEEYVTRVVARENPYYVSTDKYSNAAMKAQAVAARTYVLSYTNNGEDAIENSTKVQTYLDDGNPDTTLKEELKNAGFSEAKIFSLFQAIEETKGEILTYEDKIFLSQYDSACVSDNCVNSDFCQLKYTKQPLGEEHVFSVPSSWVKQEHKKSCDGNHGNGMSQIYAQYLQSQGKTYEEIIAFFYSNGVKITKTGLGFLGVDESTIFVTKAEQKFDNTINCNMRLSLTQNQWTESNSYLSTELKSFVGSNRGTRVGPVKAAYYLAVVLTQKNNINLPYYFGGGHTYRSLSNPAEFSPKEPIEGVHPLWGTCKNIVFSDKYKNPQFYGLDCSGFVSWSIYNGGYNLANSKTADEFKNVGILLRQGTNFVRYNIIKDYELAQIQAGDLVLNYDPIKGVYSHVGIIISINKETKYFYIAEEEGTSVGLTVTKSQNLTDWDNVVLMNKYYNNPQNIRR